MFTQSQIQGAAENMDLEVYSIFLDQKTCIYCSFDSSLFITKEIKGNKFVMLNPANIVHVYETHGYAPMFFVDWIASVLYKTEEDREKMRKLYSFFEKI